MPKLIVVVILVFFVFRKSRFAIVNLNFSIMIMLVAFLFFAAGFYREFRKLIGKIFKIVRLIANLGKIFKYFLRIIFNFTVKRQKE